MSYVLKLKNNNCSQQRLQKLVKTLFDKCTDSQVI